MLRNLILIVWVGASLCEATYSGCGERRCNRSNEVLKCVYECPPEKTCRNKNIAFRCATPTKPCEQKCVCQDGYFRNAVGDCISRKNCDRCPGDHEYFACAGFCDNVCSELQEQNKTNCPIETFVCTERCYCEDGYARDAYNNCIPIEYCQEEERRCSRSNEVLKCMYECPPEKTCRNKNIAYSCAKPTKPCKQKCVCQDGYFRNAVGDCISRKNCDRCPGDHEYFACAGFCDNVCSELQEQNKTNCPIQTFVCTERCYCEDGYARDAYNNCIPIEYCQEEERRCSRSNEVLKCVYECPPEKTCRNKNIAYSCAKPTKPCEQKCVCQDGYFRNAVGDCISRKNCDRCPGDHEYFACAGFCDNVCSELQEQNKTNCPIQTFVCTERCYCEDGYARDAYNNCIPIEYCQEAARCDRNEVFQECKTTCPPDTCESILSIYDCRSTPPCQPGCVCKDSFLRQNSTSPCMPSDTCQFN